VHRGPYIHCKVNLLFTLVIFIYKGQKIDFVVSENCLIHVKEFQKKIAGDTLTAVREASNRGRHGRDLMVDGFTTTCAISAYHH
jgi:hypothetical protein